MCRGGGWGWGGSAGIIRSDHEEDDAAVLGMRHRGSSLSSRLQRKSPKRKIWRVEETVAQAIRPLTPRLGRGRGPGTRSDWPSLATGPAAGLPRPVPRPGRHLTESELIALISAFRTMQVDQSNVGQP